MDTTTGKENDMKGMLQKATVITLLAIHTAHAEEARQDAPDDQTLAELARHDKDGTVRMEAVKKLTAQAVLAEIAKDDKNSFALCIEAIKRLEAINGLGDKQALLAEISKSPVTWHTSRAYAAVHRLHDQTLLAEVAKTASNWQVRIAAARKIESQPTLIEIANTDKNSGVRQAAVEQINDQAVLAEIARNNKDGYARETAVRRLNDQAIISEIARNEKALTVRLTAIGQLEDQVLLSEIARNDKEKNVRQAAESKLKELREENAENNVP